VSVPCVERLRQAAGELRQQRESAEVSPHHLIVDTAQSQVAALEEERGRLLDHIAATEVACRDVVVSCLCTGGGCSVGGGERQVAGVERVEVG